MISTIFKNNANQNTPNWIENYLNLEFKLPPNTPLDEISFCAIDCETTGLEKHSEVISIGAVKFNNNKIKIGESLNLRFGASKGHKQSEIHEELALSDRNYENHVKKILKYVGNSVIIGHHVAFDAKMIGKMVSKFHNGFSLRNKKVDTILLIQRLDPMRLERNVGGLKSMTLDALCNEYDIDVENRHTALGDAYMTALLFMKLLKQLKKRKIKRIKDL